jgi:UDP-glucose 4-epimerase
LEQNYHVIGIDDLSGGYAEYLPEHDDFLFWPLDLSEQKAKTLNHIFDKYDVSTCYHFAAYAAEGLSPFIRYFNYKNNVLASANVINACINNNAQIIFTSSMAVYGDQQPPFNEDMVPQPVDPYGVAKYAVEQDIKIANEQHGLRYVIVRPHNVVGIYQNIWDRYRNVVGIFIRKVLDGEPILIYGDGTQTRAFSDIKYYMQPFESMMDANNVTVNIGADQAYSINELSDTVIKVGIKHGYNATKQHVEARHEVKHAYCDHLKAKALFGFVDNTNLEESVDRMFEWAKQQPSRQQKTMSYEINKGLYEYWK